MWKVEIVLTEEADRGYGPRVIPLGKQTDFDMSDRFVFVRNAAGDRFFFNKDHVVSASLYQTND